LKLTYKKTDFFIVGAARCGTTTLWQWLRAHPSVFLPNIKEPHFFCFEGKPIPCRGNELDPHYKTQLVNSKAAYLELFADSKSTHLNGDASPGYLYFSGTASKIKRHNPDAKIICILRNPSDRAFSQFIFHVQSGFEDVFDFQTALRMENARVSKGWWWGHHYLRAGNYSSQWKEYCEVFQSSQRLLLLYEDLRANPGETYLRICNFLQIPSLNTTDLNLQANGTSDLAFVPVSFAIHRLLTHGFSKNINFHKLLPGYIVQPLKKFILAVNKRPKPILSDSLRSYLSDHYRSEVDELKLLTGLNFLQWTK
jgi:Sulfotransferase domain